MKRLLPMMVMLCVAAPAFGDPAAPLVVGTRPFAPFVVHEADGTWTGISIELWKRVAAIVNVPYVIQEEPVAALLDPDAHGVDIVVSLPITVHNQEMMDLTHAFYSTGLAIATRSEPTNGFVTIASKLASVTFVKWLGILVGVLCLVGLVVWLLARGTADEFTGHPVKGISHGVLWAFESLAGKADALTKRRGGRALTLLWTFACILLASIVTAELTTELTLSQLSTKVSGLDDLPKVKVAAIKDSLAARYLGQRRINARIYPDLAIAIDALDRGEVDAVVSEAPLVQYEVGKRPTSSLIVLPGTFQNHGYGLGVRRSHRELLPQLNTAILTIIESDDWAKVLADHLGGSHD